MAEIEYAPDNISATQLRFISEVVSVFPKDEVKLPDSHSSLCAATIKYGRVFAANANTIKVFETNSLLSGSNAALATLDAGAPVTHLTCGSDGLTLMAVVLKFDTPHALFYDVRAFVQGCSNVSPFHGTPLSNNAGSRITGMAWNPMDPASLAVANSSGDLTIITVKDNSVEFNERKNIKACAVGWSNKGKQLTVGLQDGSLSLFKPDLTPVRTILSPPLDNISSVLSINWFTNTEFFIGYGLKGEEGGHVMLYVNAPKGKAPRFVSNEFICNDNSGARPAMFYPTYITEWSLLLVLSSRAVMMGVLGSADGQPGNWCEWDIDEGAQALLQNVNLTEETFALGVAVDLTSQKSFPQKMGGSIGPCPMIITLSTGGELNMFHASYIKEGAAPLQTAAAETLPPTGLRSAQQFNYIHSPTPPVAVTVAPVAPVAVKPAVISTPPNIGVAPFSTASTALPAFGTLTNNKPFNFNAAPAASQDSSAKPNFSFNMPSGGGSLFGSTGAPSAFSAAAPTTAVTLPASSASPASTGAQKLDFSFNKLPSLMQDSKASVVDTSVSSALPSLSTSSLPKFESSKVASTTPSLFSSLGTSLGNLAAASGGSLPAASPAGGSISQGTPATPFTPTSTAAAAATIAIAPAAPVTVTPVAMPPSSSGLAALLSKPVSVTPTKVAPAVVSTQPKKAPTPLQRQPSNRGAEDEALLATIRTTMMEFEADLNHHVQMVDNTKYEVGPMSGMGTIRSSLSAESEWIHQMSKTTQELGSEVATLHSAVLEGFTLLEEADLQKNKINNPRHHNVLASRPLDPYSRRKLEEIRALYQYLQGELEEVNTRLDMDWAQHNDRINKKKSFEVPSSEMLYRVLLNCHNLRRTCEQQMDHLTHRLKKLQITSCVSSARLNNPDESSALSRLEKSLMDTSLNSSVVSPVKAMSPAKLKNLNQFLSNRTTVPVRSTSKNAPKLSYNGLEERLDRRLSAAKAADMSFDIPSKDSSFGPANFSTPNRDLAPKKSLLKDTLGVNASPAMPQGGFLIRSHDEKENVSLEIKKVSKEIPVPNTKAQLGTTYNNTPVKDTASVALPKFSSSGFSFGSKLAEAAKESPATKTQYEDITPPETPDTKPVVVSSGSSATNPLSALSSLVSMVPTTTATVQSISGVSGSLGITKSATTQPSDSISTFSFKTQPASDNGSAGFSFNLGGSSTNGTSGLFGAKSESTSTDTSTFSFKTVTSSSSTSAGGLFGSLAASTPASGSSTFSIGTTSSGGLFGSSSLASGFPKTDPSAVPSSTAAASVFGSGSSSLFGSVSTTTTTVTFGGSSSLTTATTSSTAGTTTTSSILGAPSIGDSTSSSIFGQSATSSMSSGLFGSLAKSGSGGSLFGGLAPDSDATKDNKATKLDAPVTITESDGPKVADTAEAEKGISAEADLPQVDDNSKLTDTEGVESQSVSEQVPDQNPITSIKSSDEAINLSATTAFTTASGGLFGSGGAFTVTTTSSGGLFGSSSSGGLFGASTSSTVPGGLFGSTTTTSSSGSGLFGSSSSTGSSLFGSTTTATTASSSLFGTTSTDQNTTSTSSGSIFGAGATTTTSSSTVGDSSTAAKLSTASGGSLFGATATTSATPGLFGATTTTTTATTTSASTGSPFGSASVNSTQSSSLFGATTSTSSSGSVFGGTATNSSGVFGGSSTPSGSIFGSSSAAATSPTASTPTTTTTSSGSIFGSTSTSSGVFGGASAAAPSSGSTFGSVQASTGGSVFGGASAASGSVFGSATPASGGSVFGSASTPTSGASVFGNTAPPTSSTGPFGATSTGGSTFGSSSSTFGQPAPSSSSGSVFGQSSNTTTASGSVFGQSATVGGGPSAFGSSGNSGMFGGSSSGFGTSSGGGFMSGLGSKPADSSEAKPFSAFGGKPASEAKPQTGLFGSGGSTAFGATASPASPVVSTSSVFGASATAASPTSPNSGFGGANSSFGGAPAFGAAPAFGGAPAFGAASPSKFGGGATFGGGASFGGGATFGGGSAFGSPPAFGGAAASSGPFGGSAASPTPSAGVFGGAAAPADNSGGGFSSFAASANTATFGGLASANNGSMGGNSFGGQSSGGGSFSSWR